MFIENTNTQHFLDGNKQATRQQYTVIMRLITTKTN